MNIHPILQKKIENWKQLESEIEKLSTAKERGDVFEEFVYLYFKLNETLYQFSEIYMEKDIPLKLRKNFSLEKQDSGVDGLMILRDGTATAYQVKFRTNREKPSYAELSKFWAEARKVNHHLTIANCYSLTKLAKKNKKHLSLLVDEFDALPPEFFDRLYSFVNKKPLKKKLFEPYPFQKRMIQKVTEGFRTNDRGKLIAACGTGKTFTALRISENMNTEKVLFLAPSLALIKQSLEMWADQTKEDFSYLCVCSDSTVTDDIDDGDISVSDFNVPVTTSINEINEFVEHQNSRKKVIFSTYQSLDVLSKSLKSNEFEFDLVIFDEAHRTAGATNSGLFSLALYDKHIPSDKRLFMTATERLLRPWIVKKAEEYNRIVFSMDNESLYGPVFDKFNFGEAIENSVIADYKIVVAGIKQQDIFNLIKKDEILVDIDDGTKEYYTSAQNIFRQLIILKSMQEFPIRKAITFHNRVKDAKAFVDGFTQEDINLSYLFNKLWKNYNQDDFFFHHVDGSMSAGLRKEILEYFKESKYGIISNARCLTEGVDVPLIDSVYFVNPKNSLIDIVQACGRALRKPKGKKNKTAYFIVPLLIPEDKTESEIINEVDFEMLYNLVQSLRDQDTRLAEWIDHLNLQASKGKTYRFSKNDRTPIVLNLPKEFDIKEFEEQLQIKIADVNGEPTQYTYKTKKYGVKERKSDYKRIFKTLGDYSVSSYKENLVMPTIEKFSTTNDKKSSKELKINHNNISHTRRLGLIAKRKKIYELTPLGKQLFESEVKFEDVFKRQMLRYFSTSKGEERTRILFPYRACLKILLELKSVSFIEFAFGLYSLIDSSDQSIYEAVDSIKRIRETYPNLEILNKKNQKRVLSELNNSFGTNYTITDIWDKKTTVYNQFLYFRDHLSSFDEIDKGKSIKLKKSHEAKIVELLKKDTFLEKISDTDRLKKNYIKRLLVSIIFSV